MLDRNDGRFSSSPQLHRALIVIVPLQAGVILEGNEDAVKFFTAVYEDDWARGFKLAVNQTYSSSDMGIITDKVNYSFVASQGIHGIWAHN